MCCASRKTFNCAPRKSVACGRVLCCLCIAKTFQFDVVVCCASQFDAVVLCAAKVCARRCAACLLRRPLRWGAAPPHHILLGHTSKGACLDTQREAVHIAAALRAWHDGMQRLAEASAAAAAATESAESDDGLESDERQ